MANKVNSDQLRQTLMQDLLSARKQTDQLFQMLSPAALNERPIPERHRIIFYLGHLEAFDWNMIGTWAFHKPSFNSGFDRLFAFGIDPWMVNCPTTSRRTGRRLKRLGRTGTRFGLRLTVFSVSPILPTPRMHKSFASLLNT